MCVYVCVLHVCVRRAQIRARVDEVRRRLEVGCELLCAVVRGSPRTAALRLDQLQDLVLPLLASPIAGTCVCVRVSVCIRVLTG